MLSVGDKGNDLPACPRSLQKSAYSAHPEIALLVKLFWVTFVLATLWWVGVLIAMPLIASNIAQQGYVISSVIASMSTPMGWLPIPDLEGASPFILILIIDFEFSDPLSPIALIIITVFQAALTFGLHSIDLLINVSRDEDIWRTTSTRSGYDPNYNSILSAIKNWKYVTIFLIKPFVHWLFGMGLTYYDSFGLVMRPAQLLYLSLAILAIAIGATVTSRRGRKGPQPVNFGHIQTVVNLVDEWHERLYWGHKSEDETTGVCAAGTSDKPLPDIKMDRFYL